MLNLFCTFGCSENMGKENKRIPRKPNITRFVVKKLQQIERYFNIKVRKKDSNEQEKTWSGIICHSLFKFHLLCVVWVTLIFFCSFPTNFIFIFFIQEKKKSPWILFIYEQISSFIKKAVLKMKIFERELHRNLFTYSFFMPRKQTFHYILILKKKVVLIEISRGTLF